MMIRSDDPQPQAPNARRKRKIPVRGIVFLTVAVVAALAAAVLLTKYMDARVAAARVPTTKIVVADVDIPVATPIKAEWLKAIDWPATARPEGAVSDPAAIVNQVATVPITRGEPVLPAKLAVGGAARSGLATLVPEGMRAVAVKVDDVVGVAGFIHPGDNVDVLVTMQPRNDAPFVSKIVLQNIKVLAVGKELEHRGKDARRGRAGHRRDADGHERGIGAARALHRQGPHPPRAARPGRRGVRGHARHHPAGAPAHLRARDQAGAPVAAAPSRARRRELARNVTPRPSRRRSRRSRSSAAICSRSAPSTRRRSGHEDPRRPPVSGVRAPGCGRPREPRPSASIARSAPRPSWRSSPARTGCSCSPRRSAASRSPNPTVADLKVVTPNQLLLTAKSGRHHRPHRSGTGATSRWSSRCR